MQPYPLRIKNNNKQEIGHRLHKDMQPVELLLIKYAQFNRLLQEEQPAELRLKD